MTLLVGAILERYREGKADLDTLFHIERVITPTGRMLRQ
ncbi:hypothetical protein PLUTE_a2234 [Pseudoalteromonas luteoviolacea DSM 6061]|nr:hypothetical protein [Pseudoalteromonas luteoviolacea DSM 6061]